MKHRIIFKVVSMAGFAAYSQNGGEINHPLIS
jgi:hypothetical protein